MYVTGTFDNWEKTEQLDRVGDIFEKKVTLPVASEKIYYKVGVAPLSPPLSQPPTFSISHPWATQAAHWWQANKHLRSSSNSAKAQNYAAWSSREGDDASCRRLHCSCPVAQRSIHNRLGVYGRGNRQISQWGDLGEASLPSPPPCLAS